MDWGMGLWEEDDGGAGVWAGRGVMWNRAEMLWVVVNLFNWWAEAGVGVGGTSAIRVTGWPKC